MPPWVTSDSLTAVGVLGAAITALGYWLANFNIDFIVLAMIGLVINWLGDSLDGTLARHRKAERPQYGFFIDHTVDAFAIAMIAIGIGLSPLVQMTSALVVLASYYVLVILSMTTCLATGVFRVSFGRVGPTEVRIFIAAFSLSAMAFPISHFSAGSMRFSTYDLILMITSLAFVGSAIAHFIRTARGLAEIDPPRHRGA